MVVVDLSVLADEPYPAIILIIGGLLSIFVALYGRRDDSHLDELGTFVAFVLGILMGIIAFFFGTQEEVNWFTLVVLIVVAVTLFLKPMKEIPWAGVVGMAAGAVAVYVGNLYLPEDVFGVEKWIVLVVVFFIVGAIVHMLFHFVEDVLTITQKVLDWKPVMVIVGLVAIVEGVLVLMGSSLMSFL